MLGHVRCTVAGYPHPRSRIATHESPNGREPMNSAKNLEETPEATNDVDLFEEELTAEKHVRDRGEVRLHKRVVVKQRKITVPVMHEEIVVERVPYATAPPTRLPE